MAQTPRSDGGLALAPARCAAPTMQYRKAGWFPGTFAPSYLDGSLPGDVGFDPASMVALARTNLKADEENPWADGNFESKIQLVMMSDYVVKRKLAWMREAEIKHARLAMLAAAGWPLSEMLDGPLSSLLGVPNALAAGGRAPSLFNGGLFEGPQGLFLGLVTLAIKLLQQFLDWANRLYVLTDRRVIRRRGILQVDVFEARLDRIQQTNVLQLVRERMLGLGTVAFATAGTGTLDALWEAVPEPFTVHAEVSKAIDRYGRGGGGV